jgi:hypothetical protein
MTRLSPNPSTTTCATRSRRTRPFVFAALAVSRWIERQTGWFIRKFIKTTRRCRTIQIQAVPHTITVADPLPAGLRAALDQIHGRPAAH